MELPGRCIGRTDMVTEEFFNDNFYKLLEATAEYAETQMKSSTFEKFYISFDVPGRRNYEKFFLTFIPDNADSDRRIWRLEANVRARWNQEYAVRQRLFVGTGDEVLRYLRKPDTEEELKNVIRQLDESSGHEHPRDQ